MSGWRCLVLPRGSASLNKSAFAPSIVRREVGYQSRPFLSPWEDNHMGTILLIVLILLLVGALPTWPYSREWGYFPSGALGTILLILLILVLLGRL